MSTQNQTKEEKVWEKAWNSSDLINSSTNWSLAGDAGLLLNLKQFSDNILSKAVAIEKELQKLAYEEKQCHVKFENSTSNFLLLENSQFFENRVYEEDIANIIESKSNQEKQKEKTKEEKEQELYLIINDSVRLGMSIMDNYFDKLDAKALKNSDDDQYDDEDDYYSDNRNSNQDQENASNKLREDDLVIYEAKDPYVLRSLPYLIGSQLYLENDHVGLKDLDEDDEVDDLDEQQENEQDSQGGDLESTTSESSYEKSESSDDELFNAKTTKPKKEISFDNDHDEQDEDELFSSKNIKIEIKESKNLFSENDSEDQDDQEEMFPSKSKMDVQDEISNEKEVEEAPKVNKPMDFASELSLRLSSKSKPEVIKQTKEPAVIKQVEEKPKKPATTNLFDESDDKEDDENDLFTNKKISFANSKKSKKSLFDDSDSGSVSDHDQLSIKTESKPQVNIDKESPVMEKKVENKKPESSLTNELNKVLKQNLENKKNFDFDTDSEEEEAPKLPLSNELSRKPSNPAPIKIIKKVSLFDDDDEEDNDNTDQDLFGKNEPKLKPASNITQTEAKPQPASLSTTKKVSSLFDDDDNDDDEDDLFKTIPKPNIPKIEIPNTGLPKLEEANTENHKLEKNSESKIVKESNNFLPPSKPSLFEGDGDGSESEEDSFNQSKNNLFSSTSNKTEITNSNETKINKVSLFENLSKTNNFDDDDENSDLFGHVTDSNSKNTNLSSTINNNEPKQSSVKNEIKKSIFFDDFDTEKNDEELFQSNSKTNPVQSKQESKADENKKSLFDSLSDPEQDDDLFKSSKPKVIVKDQEKEKLEELEDKDTKATEIKISKPQNKNVLFDPLGLKSNSLFKKLAQVAVDSESDVEEEIKKPEIIKKAIEKNKENALISDDPFESFVKPKEKTVNEQKTSSKSSDDTFENIKVDSKFYTETGLKNAQKVLKKNTFLNFKRLNIKSNQNSSRTE